MTTPNGYSVIAAEFNKPLVEGMIKATLEQLQVCKLNFLRLLRVPGCYELPLIAKLELTRSEVNGLIVLGYIEKGETQHGEVMGHVVNRALLDLQLNIKKPIGMGIIGPSATEAQAFARHVNSAKAAVVAIKQVADLLHSRPDFH